MSNPDFLIRPLSRDELDTVFQWSALEGWNPGLQDGDSFHAADPAGFLGGFLQGELIGSVSAVAYGESYGFIGLYIVKPDYRGQGYGIRLFKAALGRLGDRVIGLDGVVARQADYARSGFRAVYRHLRFAGLTQEGVPSPSGIIPLAQLPFTEVLRYDKNLVPAPRRALLETWIDRPQTSALGRVRDGRLIGYGVIRPALAGYRIGPLFADDEEGAGQLFLALHNSVETGAQIFLDAPEINPAALRLAQKYGMAMVFETARMYKGEAPALPVERIYGVTTLELG
ncbi:MAG: GNAT family N-acetyltransferase [Methylococcaceae bacterium]|nr:GNAT family N-acetyltransferase [Methylococcaceae bacterium]